MVARFRTDPGEVVASGVSFTPPLHFAMPFGKAGLYVFGLVLGVLIAFGRDYLPGWPDWLSTSLFSLVVGLLLSTLLWTALGRRNQRLLAAIGRTEETQEVTVSCGDEVLTWSTAEISHRLAYAAIDEAKEQGDMLLIRYKLFVLYVPARGFASPEDRDYLIGALCAHVAPEKLAGLGASA